MDNYSAMKDDINSSVFKALGEPNVDKNKSEAVDYILGSLNENKSAMATRKKLREELEELREKTHQMAQAANEEIDQKIKATMFEETVENPEISQKQDSAIISMLEYQAQSKGIKLNEPEKAFYVNQNKKTKDKSITKSRVPNNQSKTGFNKKLLVVGSCGFLVAASVLTLGTLKIAKDKAKNYNLAQNESLEIEKTVDLYDNAEDLFIDLSTNYYDPTVVMYLAYQSLGSSNDKINQNIGTFNKIFRTNYQSLSDFLQKNGFRTITDLEQYVGRYLGGERHYDEDNLGR